MRLGSLHTWCNVQRAIFSAVAANFCGSQARVHGKIRLHLELRSAADTAPAYHARTLATVASLSCLWLPPLGLHPYQIIGSAMGPCRAASARTPRGALYSRGEGGMYAWGVGLRCADHREHYVERPGKLVAHVPRRGHLSLGGAQQSACVRWSRFGGRVRRGARGCVAHALARTCSLRCVGPRTLSWLCTMRDSSMRV